MKIGQFQRKNEVLNTRVINKFSVYLDLLVIFNKHYLIQYNTFISDITIYNYM